MRRAGRLAPVMLLALAVLGPAPASVANPSGPPPIPPVEAVVEIGTIEQNPVISGRDGTFSALFEGQSVWTFGDTSMSVPGVEDDFWNDNTLSWTTDLVASDGFSFEGDLQDPTGAPGEYLPLTPKERSYNYVHHPDHCTAQPCGAEFSVWGGPVVADPDRHRLLFFYPEVWRVAGQLGWRDIGTGIAVGRPGSDILRPILSPGSPTPTLMWGAGEVGFAGGSVVVGSTLFSYGCRAGFLVQHCAIGRVELADVLDKATWTYYAGGGRWTPDQSKAVPVFDGGAAGNSVFHSRFLGEYVAVYSGVLTNDIYYRVSYTPWGPWSDQALLFTGKPGWNGRIDYAGMAHPEFAEGDGRVQYVTYYHTTGFLRSDLPLVQVTFGLP
jgi:hypothetical protein